MAKCTSIAARLSNFVVMLIGLVLAGYSIYMIIQAKGISILSGAVLALGVVDAGLGLGLVACGHRSVFFLKFYLFLGGLLELGQIAVAILFLIPSTQKNILDTISPPADLRSEIESNLTTAGYVLIAVVAFQALTITLVAMQLWALDRGFVESDYDQESLLGGARGGGKAGAGAGADNRFSALEDEAVSAAASRYRNKAGRFYEKYGIK